MIEVGKSVKRFKAGDVVVTHCNGEPDMYGYPLRIWAYDQPDSIGWYGEEAVVGDWQIIPAPLGCGLNLWEIAALPLRAPTAYHLWRRALGIYRLKVGRGQRSVLNVLGFGGGVSELFLMLAQHEGHRAIFCSGSPERRKHLESLGIESIDQKAFNRFTGKDDVKNFNKHVKGMTGGDGVQIVCDMLRGPVYAAGLAVLARMGVNVSAGWQLDTACNYNSANLSVRQITLDHVHFETVEGCERSHRALRQRVPPHRSPRDLQVRGSAARDGRDARERADWHPDRARGGEAAGVGAQTRSLIHRRSSR